jgi:diguanylate cyclase (GGDEF)-like protein
VGWAICSAALSASGAEVAVLWRPSGSGSELIAASAAGEGVDGVRIPFVAPDSGAIRAFTGAEDRFEQLGTDGAAQELVPRHEAAAALWQPVQSDSAVVGVLAVYWNGQREEAGDGVRQAMRLLALEAAIAIERGELLGRLEEAARTDDLTGLLNRRAWSTELSREMARADRSGKPLCVAVLDLDRFKQYNDAHGHQAGNHAITAVASAIQRAVRNTDMAARAGGDEFLIFLPEATPEVAETVAQRIRNHVYRSLFPVGERLQRMTVSVGTATWPRDGSHPEDVISAAALRARRDRELRQAADPVAE